ncbi:TonB family protein [Piscinibacter sp.]|jgi:protein TonB|uniref:TonB family protein n=1 Tax=Piscinibacter sp. TaxID=1903157 RepID=UPI002F409990
MSTRFQQRPSAGRCSLIRRAAGLSALSAICSASSAQTTAAAAPAASAPTSEAAASERAKRETDKVFQWIRIHSDKPRKTATVKDERTTAIVPTGPVKVAAKPLPKAGEPARNGSPRDAARASVTGDAVQRETAASLPATEPSPAAAGLPTAKPDAASVDQRLASVAPPAAPQDPPDVALIPVHRTEPDFPGNLMRTLRKGMVQVSFTVQPDGSVTQAQAVASTNPRLNPAAVATVAQWRFQPLPHAQQAVVDLGFNLD